MSSSDGMQFMTYCSIEVPVPLMYCMGDRNIYVQNTTCRNTFIRWSISAFAISLLVSDGFYRVHIGGLLGRDVAEEYANEYANEERDVDAPCRYAAGHSEG